jgi:hypothetical protein
MINNMEEKKGFKMFYEKSNKLMGVSLAVVSLLLSIWGMTSVLHAQSGFAALDVSGTLTYAGCKVPCVDTWIDDMIECLDTTGSPPCNTQMCDINNFRYLECTPCDSSNKDDDDCKYHLDNNQWLRWETVRVMNCTSTTPGYIFLDKCNRAGNYEGFYTPCINGECTGDLYSHTATEWGRAVCGD